MFILIKIVCVLLLPLITSTQANSEAFRVGFSTNKPPFVFSENNITQGIEIDIVREALNFKGHSIKSNVLMPYSRLVIGIENNYADIVTGVQSPKLDDGFFYSDHYVSFENYAISLAESQIVINHLEDLKHYSIATWKNAYRHLGPIFNKIYDPKSNITHKKYSEFSDQLAQVEFFLLKRSQVLLIDKTIFYWQRKSFLENNKTLEKLKLKIKKQTYVLYKISTKPTVFNVKFSQEKLRNDFNEGLQHLRESGRYQAILNNYKSL